MNAKSRKPAVNRSKSIKQSGVPEYTAESVLAQLKKLGDERVREQMGTRFGITGPTAQKSFGVSMANMKALAKKIGRSHDLALALWETGWYEARMMASLVDEPQRVTPAQMDKWCRAFDNWGICDTVCFCLFDRSPHAMARIKKWAGSREEFVKRGAFALLACVALHDKSLDDDAFFECLPLIERSADDERNFVKKGVSWALRAVGRRSSMLKVEAVAIAERLADSQDSSAKWIGRDALRDFGKLKAAGKGGKKKRMAKKDG